MGQDKKRQTFQNQSQERCCLFNPDSIFVFCHEVFQSQIENITNKHTYHWRMDMILNLKEFIDMIVHNHSLDIMLCLCNILHLD